ncbi:MAG: SPFH domain-containing protein [Candidatus Gracilibacteria bacterium]|nr:SPFH domain-containing protein [Candidatus Gracilibacteria bacterium]
MDLLIDIIESPFVWTFFIACTLFLALFAAFLFRVVVSTNETHIVQTKNKTIPYGKGYEAGGVYYKWPRWIPQFGITRIVLPVSIFDIDLENYHAYDNGKVPFVVDIKAFFRIADASVAAQRIENFVELKAQLLDVLKGSVRKILASYDIIEIMEGRGIFGEKFEAEVTEQVKQWGVEVKNMEFMDIRDGEESHVINNIMLKKESLIEKESRIEVALNHKEAKVAEIEAQQIMDIRDQEAQQLVGEREAQKSQMIGIATEKAQQEIQAEKKTTADKEMEVQRVREVKDAEIKKQVQIVKSEEEQQKLSIEASGKQSEIETLAEADMNAEKKRAEGIKQVGIAEAEVIKEKELAPVMAQIKLAQEIGANENYLEYLLGIKGFDVSKLVGLEKAQALQKADIKIISTGKEGSLEGDTKSIMNILSPEGGAKLGAMIDAFDSTSDGKKLKDLIMNRHKKSEQVNQTEVSKQDEEVKPASM